MEENETLDSCLESVRINPDFAHLCNLLRFLRSTRLRRSDAVVYYGQILLKKFSNSLRETEMWEIYEQLFVAALDTNNNKLANELLNKIKAQFKNGIRVRRLCGLQLEQQEKWEEANDLYNKILEEDPTNSLIMKRQIAIRKALGDIDTTIKLLNDYLKFFMADTEAWQELSEIYLDQQMFKNASFCYEELILAFPQNFLYYVKYAEILYTLGGYDNFRNARKYYALSLESNSEVTNIRGLYGICISAISVASTKQGKQDKDNGMIFEYGFKKLSDYYKQKCPSRLPQIMVLQNMMNKESS